MKNPEAGGDRTTDPWRGKQTCYLWATRTQLSVLIFTHVTFQKKKFHGDLSFFNMNFFKKHSWNPMEIKIWTQFKNDSVPMCDVIQLEIFLPHLIFREGHSAIEESQLHWLSKAIRLRQSWFLSCVLHKTENGHAKIM